MADDEAITNSEFFPLVDGLSGMTCVAEFDVEA
jgi:hypothetical protein